ncbi:MAG: hypothetical protein LBK94_13305, partial [Prevotellaceae bacterium]|nr:hypothetical protein [Prevotellaceae bacterium]
MAKTYANTDKTANERATGYSADANAMLNTCGAGVHGLSITRTEYGKSFFNTLHISNPDGEGSTISFRRMAFL